MSATSNEEGQEDVKVPAEDLVWKFGYGSNMDVEFLTKKKKVQVIDAFPGIAKNYRLAFPRKGMQYVEPSFATIHVHEGDEVHGVITSMKKADAEILDKAEGGGDFYHLVKIPVTTYDGREIMAEAYTAMAEDVEKDMAACSWRYLQILIRGATTMKLDPAWIKKLESLPTYKPDADCLARRDAIPPRSELKEFTIEELKEYNGTDESKPIYTSSMGYVIKTELKFFKVFYGRDVTYRNLFHFRGVNIDENDTKGLRPFPVLSQLAEDEIAYLKCWRDFLMDSDPKNIVGVLKEFWEDQTLTYQEGFTSAPFHHAFPTHSVEASRQFYGNVLGFPEGRSSEKWIDFNCYGSQIVAHFVGEDFKAVDYRNPVDGDEVPVPHFGVALTVKQFHELADRLKKNNVKFIIEPHLRFVGERGEQWTMFFKDPSNNNLEFKAMTKPLNLFAKYVVKC